MNFKVSMKINGKWQTVGNIKKNKYGNMSLGLMKKPEVLEALKGDGWANFALFEDQKKDDTKQESLIADATILDDDLPF